MNKSWLIELISLMAIAIIVVLVISPIRKEIYGFPFEKSNVFFIIAFFTFIRWFLFLKTTPFNRNMIVKAMIGIGCIWLAMYSLKEFGLFQAFINDKGVESITFHLTDDRQIALGKYIISEFVFFGVGTIILCILMPFKMLISIWRTYNLNKV